MSKHNKKLLIFALLYFILNIANTYFVTTAPLNRYLTAFERTPLFELNSVGGNFAVLSIIFFIGCLIFNKTNKRLVFLIVVTFLLNTLIFSLGVFTKYYQTIFSLYEMTLFKNPATTLGISILIESLKELVVYFRIVVYIPAISLLAYYTYLRRYYSKSTIKIKEEVVFSYKPLNIMFVISGFILSLTTLGIFNISMNSNWTIYAERPLYGVQTAGLYNYYFGQLLGFRYDYENVVEADPSWYIQYNKNRDTYTNVYGETYSRTLNKTDASTVLLKDDLNQNTLNGILKDKNLVLVHVESFNHFLLDESGPFLDETYLPIFKSLLEESYVLDNFYTNVGLGNSSDAELSVLTGLYPSGDTTLYWNYKNGNYNLPALPQLFSDRLNVSIHGDVLEFYNRGVVHEELFGFNDYYYYNPNEEEKELTKNGYYKFSDITYTSTEDSPWLSDLSLLDWTKAVYEMKEDKKVFLFPITIQPHTPYDYNPYENRFSLDDMNVESTTLRYLNYEAYIESFYKKFIEITHQLENTVYVFYSDHGSGIPQVDLATILGKTPSNSNSEVGDDILSRLEYQREMIRTLAFIYVPDDNHQTDGLKRGLMTGTQPLVRSQVDLYRTIVELFDLKTDHYYFGVNALSDEHTFAIDSRTFSVVTDDYYIVGKRMHNTDVLDKNNIFIINPDYIKEPIEFLEYVYLYKQRMDRAMRTNLYQHLKN